PAVSSLAVEQRRSAQPPLPPQARTGIAVGSRDHLVPPQRKNATAASFRATGSHRARLRAVHSKSCSIVACASTSDPLIRDRIAMPIAHPGPPKFRPRDSDGRELHVHPHRTSGGVMAAERALVCVFLKALRALVRQRVAIRSATERRGSSGRGRGRP